MLQNGNLVVPFLRNCVTKSKNFEYFYFPSYSNRFIVSFILVYFGSCPTLKRLVDTYSSSWVTDFHFRVSDVRSTLFRESPTNARRSYFCLSLVVAQHCFLPLYRTNTTIEVGIYFICRHPSLRMHNYAVYMCEEVIFPNATALFSNKYICKNMQDIYQKVKNEG